MTLNTKSKNLGKALVGLSYRMSCVLLTVEKDSLPLGMVGTSSSASAASFKILLTNALIQKQLVIL